MKELVEVGEFCPNDSYERYEDVAQAQIIRFGQTKKGTQQDVIDNTDLQYAALSAAVSNPAAARYFPDTHVVAVSGGRSLQAEIMPFVGEAALHDYLRTFKER